MRKREFIAPNGMRAEFLFRDGTNDESTIIALFEEDYYNLIGEKLKTNTPVLDLGAHVGAFSVLAGMMGMWVISVEALPENCGLLISNLRESGLKPKLYRRLIWSKTGEKKEIYYGDDTEMGKVHNFVGSMAIGGKPKKDTRKSVSIETLSLDDLFEQEDIKNCFVKIDIEGAEGKVLLGASKKTLSKISTIRGEYHNGDYHDLLKKMKDFKDCTPPEMNPEKASQTEFLWRRK